MRNRMRNIADIIRLGIGQTIDEIRVTFAMLLLQEVQESYIRSMSQTHSTSSRNSLRAVRRLPTLNVDFCAFAARDTPPRWDFTSSLPYRGFPLIATGRTRERRERERESWGKLHDSIFAQNCRMCRDNSFKWHEVGVVSSR